MERSPVAWNEMLDRHAIILFDGYCNLCTRSVQFILPKDRKGYFRFLSLEDDKTSSLFAAIGASPPAVDSIVLVDHRKVYTRSSAALRIAGKLGGGWPLLQIGYIVPKFLRDPIYDWIARNRYRWFGKKDTCWLPRPEWTSRFL